jgi:hypothetical protein
LLLRRKRELFGTFTRREQPDAVAAACCQQAHFRFSYRPLLGLRRRVVLPGKKVDLKMLRFGRDITREPAFNMARILEAL